MTLDRVVKTLLEMQYRLDQLQYDFSTFEIHDFIAHIEQLRKTRIVLIPFPFDGELTGIWVPVEGADYIFYQKCSHPLYQNHIILHEIAHMLLDHRCYKVEDVLPADFMAQLQTPIIGRLREISTNLWNDTEELEAEHFVMLIQKSVVYLNRIDELTCRGSSIEAVQYAVAGLAYER